MAKRDFYQVLEVGRGASGDDLKKAYRRLAKQCHPDRNPDDAGAEAKFKEISEAYDVLRDEQRRAAYDQFGHAAFDSGTPGAGAGFSAASFADVFDDLFGEFTGRGRGPQTGRRGADLRYNLEITLEDAYRGKQASLRTTTTVGCESCAGTGAKAGSRPSNCPGCHGSGRVRAQQGFFTIERSCPSCQGVGKVIEDPCQACRGTGRVAKERALTVNIPRGVEDGMRIRLAGEGEAGVRGSPAGDLYIFVSIAPHRLFKRDGQNLFCRVPVAMTSATLGNLIDVPTLDGKRARLTVPEGTQSGHQFRLRGKGMPSVRGEGVGDLFVQTVVETPVNLTPRQKELLREFEAAGGDETSPEASGFFARVKEFWSDLTE